MSTIVLIILVLILLGGFVPTRDTPEGSWYHGYGYGWPGGSVLGIILVIILILVLTGRF